MNKFIKINDRKIGYDFEPAIIAEIGINHGGSIKVAKKMVDEAKKAGIEMIKHQTHIVDDEMSSEAKKNKIGYIGKSIYDLMNECALSYNDELELKNYTEENGMIFLSTPFSRAAADRLMEFDVPAFKIGSGECNNYPLIKHIASFKKPILLSTGMNAIEIIKKSVKIIESFDIDYGLLHTTNIYPTPPELARLGGVTELIDAFPNSVIGYSDHTTTNHACFGAVALGACFLERHFTDNMDRIGPDIENSMDPKSAKELIEGSKIIFKARGGSKGLIDEEKAVSGFAFASVVSIKDIKRGDILSYENIWVKRPGGGYYNTNDFEKILGKRALRDIKKDVQIRKDDIE